MLNVVLMAIYEDVEPVDACVVGAVVPSIVVVRYSWDRLCLSRAVSVVISWGSSDFRRNN